jgi:DNA-binding CsgD family transcriptional regulator
MSTAGIANANRRYTLPSTELTAREQEVLRLLLQGHSLRQVSQALSITYDTARKYRTQLYAKLGVHRAVDLPGAVFE